MKEGGCHPPADKKGVKHPGPKSVCAFDFEGEVVHLPLPTFISDWRNAVFCASLVSRIWRLSLLIVTFKLDAMS